uniref:Fibroblast growth factor n=1 Tax=Oryzias latipes TaxID=8090 RepID=A0A3P9KBQ2_ORYLA
MEGYSPGVVIRAGPGGSDHQRGGRWRFLLTTAAPCSPAALVRVTTRRRGWSVLMMSVFCDAGRSLGEPEVIQEQLLYCRVGIGFHLQILPGGSVRGVHRPTQYSWLKLFSIRPGLVAIRGVRSGLFLCMSRDGWAHGAFSDDCIFKENLEENHYTTYSSYSHPGNYLALSRKGELRRGGSANRNQASTHFLPRRRLW